MNNIASQLCEGIGKANEYLAKTKLPMWGKILAIILLFGLIVVFGASVVSIIVESINKQGITDINKVEIFVRTFFNGGVMAAIYADLRLLIDDDKDGVPDVLREEKKQ